MSYHTETLTDTTAQGKYSNHIFWEETFIYIGSNFTYVNSGIMEILFDIIVYEYAYLFCYALSVCCVWD